MTEPSPPQEAVVTWNAVPNHTAGTMDFEFEVSPPIDALVDVQRRVPPSVREEARARGVPAHELDEPVTVVENVPIRRGRGSWRDFFCEPGVAYQYRVRTHDLAVSVRREEPAASPA